MASEVGRSPTQLAEALYPILSAFSGIQNQSAKSSLALSTLKLSFEAVAGTTVDGTQVANAAVGTFNALGLATNNAGVNAKRMANLFDIMDLTVQQGNMQWGAWNTYVAKPLRNLWNSFLNFVNGWPKQAVQWGINLIQGLINGITSMIGNIGKTVGNIGHTIASFLGFHCW